MKNLAQITKCRGLDRWLCALVVFPVVMCFGNETAATNCTGKGETALNTQMRGMKIVPSVRTDVPGYTKVITFSTESGAPAISGGWGHECKFTVPNEKGVYEVELFGLDGKPQRPAKHKGLCLSFVCKDHFDKRDALPIRLTVDPIVLSVGGVAKMGVYGQLQRVYDADGNELVLNRNAKGGYILFFVSPGKKILAKYYLANGNALQDGGEGYAYAVYSYSSDGVLAETKKFDVEGKPVE